MTDSKIKKEENSKTSADSKTNIFESILRISRARLIQHDRLRAQWEEKGKFYADHKTAKGKANCAWCTKGKRTDFKEEDRSTDSVWCGWCIDFHMLMPGATGYEPHLKGPALVKLIALNSHVLTTASTNRPDDVNFQAMFVTFYAPKEIITKVREGIAQLNDPYYEMLSDHRDTFGDYGPQQNALIESMECVDVIDHQQKRRSLYDILLKILSEGSKSEGSKSEGSKSEGTK